MAWKPIDFQSIVVLDKPVIELLNSYLEEKETQLANTILAVIPRPVHEQHPQLPHPEISTSQKLSKAIESFEKIDYFNSHNSTVALNDFQQMLKKIEAGLWDYLEALEGCLTELFQQLDQISLEQWHDRLANVITSIKEILQHRMEDLMWAIRRLENQLWKCRLACEKPNSIGYYYKKLSQFGTTLLDKSLIDHLTKSQEYLRTQYQKFMKRYQGYQQLEKQVFPHLEKLSNYRVFRSLDAETRQHLSKLYLLIKLWEYNRTAKALSSKTLIVSLRNVLTVDKATSILREYYKALRNCLFQKSIAIKGNAQEFLSDSLEQIPIEAVVLECIGEVHLLGGMITNYREFLLRADPDPYIRTRLGFSEGPVGAEPTQTKPLLNLGYDVEALNDLYEQLLHSLRKEGPPTIEISQADPLLQNALHEINQPLIPHRIIRSRSEEILGYVQQLNELGSPNQEVIPYVGKVFSKMLRADWKYHVVFGIPLFHQLYSIHHGLVKRIDDRSHDNRLARFSTLLQQIQDFAKAQKTQTHAHEIELDMNDIKGYLQDFLATIQRTKNDLGKNKEQALSQYNKFAQELLEYRYLFGNFFYQLRQNESEGNIIRRQFLFVDQYFETVEQKLYELQQEE